MARNENTMWGFFCCNLLIFVGMGGGGCRPNGCGLCKNIMHYMLDKFNC